MPLFLAILAGTAIAAILVWSGLVTSSRMITAVYGVLGGLLGVIILRFIVGPLGIVGAVIAAAIGAVVLLWVAKKAARSDEE